jgi:formylglycine-generating enzyme required for sulfatase activity
MSWAEAVAFCSWLTRRWRKARRLEKGWEVRLPSEAEWEKAARGGRVVPTQPEVGDAEKRLAVTAAGEEKPNPLPGRRYPWGGEADRSRANYLATGIAAVSAVGCFPSGASPYGCEEMAGSIWEWTGNPYRGEARQPAAPILRALRGGGFYDPPRKIGTTSREWGPTVSTPDNGFRVMLAPVKSGG